MTDTELATADTTTPDIDALFEDVLRIMRGAQEANWFAAWDLGALLADLLAEQDGYGRSLAKALVQRLKDHGVEVALSSLYAYRQIHLAYDRTEIPDLLERGVTQSHAQLLAGLEPDIRRTVEERMYLSDGRCIATRELKKLINAVRKEIARADSTAIADRSAEAWENSEPIAYKDAVDSEDFDAQMRSSGGGDAALHGGDVPDRGADGSDHDVAVSEQLPADHARMGTIAAPRTDVHRAEGTAEDAHNDRQLQAAINRGSKGFTESPIKLVKAADNAAIKMMGQVSGLMIAMDEAARIGYDSDRSAKNFLDQARSLEASLISYERTLPELLKRLRSTINSLGGPE